MSEVYGVPRGRLIDFDTRQWPYIFIQWPYILVTTVSVFSLKSKSHSVHKFIFTLPYPVDNTVLFICWAQQYSNCRTLSSISSRQHRTTNLFHLLFQSLQAISCSGYALWQLIEFATGFEIYVSNRLGWCQEFCLIFFLVFEMQVKIQGMFSKFC